MIKGHKGQQPQGGWWMGWHCTQCGNVGHKTGYDTERQATQAFDEATMEHIQSAHSGSEQLKREPW